jgi:hypothetical protein
MQKLNGIDLTISSLGAIFMGIGKRSCESHLSRKDETMKLTSSACRAANHAYQIHTSVARKPRGAEELARNDRQADGRFGLAGGRSALAQVHESEPRYRTPDGRTDAVHDDGAARTRPGDTRTHLESDAGARCDDRLGAVGVRVVSDYPSGQLSQSIATIVRDALRAAVYASTDKAALDVVGVALQTIAAIPRGEVSHV